MKNPFEIEKEEKTLDIQFREPCYTCNDIDAQTNATRTASFVFYRTYVTIYCGHQNVCAKYLEDKAKEEASNFKGYCEHDAEMTVKAWESAREDFEKMKNEELGEPTAITYHRSFPDRIYVDYPVNIEKIELAIKNFDGEYPSSQKVARNIDDSIIIVNVEPYYRIVYERTNDDSCRATWIKQPLLQSGLLKLAADIGATQFSPLTLENLDEDKNIVREELEQIELKSDELDRRELGAQVLVRGIPPTKVHQCGHCEEVLPVTLKMKYYNYCSHCGYRLIHPEPDTYTVQINGKDVVLQKGVDYEVIPRKEICYL